MHGPEKGMRSPRVAHVRARRNGHFSSALYVPLREPALPPHNPHSRAGFFFLFLAGVIGWRVYNFVNASNRYALLGLSGLMGLAGLICVFYQRYWFFSLSAGFRVPIYAVLGVSLSFALSFAMAELLNYASTQSAGIVGGGVAPRAQHALVQSPQQIFLLATSSVALGFVYGIIFGFAEIGKGVFTLHTLRVRRGFSGGGLLESK